MTPGTWDFNIYKGSLFEAHIEWKDENLVLVPITNFIWKMQIRDTWGSATVIHELNATNGGIIATDPGELDLYIPVSVTKLMDFWEGVYDLEFEPPSGPEFTDKLFRGKVKLLPESTR